MEKVRSKDCSYCDGIKHSSSVSSWKKSHVIIYDPVISKLQEAKVFESETSKLIRSGVGRDLKIMEIGLLKKVHAPGRSNRVKLYLNMGQEERQIKTYVAKIDLGQLGSHVRWQRLCGNIDSIYLKGKEGPEPVSGC